MQASGSRYSRVGANESWKGLIRENPFLSLVTLVGFAFKLLLVPIDSLFVLKHFANIPISNNDHHQNELSI